MVLNDVPMDPSWIGTELTFFGYGLTATPLQNGLHELYGILSLLDKEGIKIIDASLGIGDARIQKVCA